MAVDQQPTTGIDRRSFVRRAVAVSAVTAWATPTVQSLAAPAFATGTARGGCSACMTGGGFIVSTTAASVVFMGKTIPRLSFGLGRICCEGTGPTEIEVNAHPTEKKKDDISYHFTTNLTLTCTKTGNPAPPKATADCANKFAGTVYDKDGNRLEFVFEDFGEPGQAVDMVSIQVFGPTGNAILSGAGTLAGGNLQVHEGLGKLKRDCSGC